MTKIQVGKIEVDLDEDNLKFNEATINEYLQKEAANYNYYSEMLARANLIYTYLEDEYEHVLAEAFIKNKDGSSDKLAEAKSSVEPAVAEALKKVRQAKTTKDLISSYLRSMDKAHDNCLNLAFNMRKEMDKIFGSIKKTDSSSVDWGDVVEKADAIVGRKP